MKCFIRIITALAVLIAALAVFTGCQELTNPVETEDLTAVQSYTVNDSNFDLSQLKQYPNLKTLNLHGYRNYEAIMQYMRENPQVEVSYHVLIGSQSYANNAEVLVFEDGELPYEDVMSNLQYLPNVKKVLLPETTLSPDQIRALQEAYPDVLVEYTLMFQGNVYTCDTTELNLSWMEPEQIDEILNTITLLPNLHTIELMASDGTSKLDLTDVKKLQDALPQTFFNYSFDLFGKTVSTTDEVIEYDEVDIGNQGEERIRQALDILTNLTYFKVDNCGIDNEVMDGIRQDYPDVKVVWRVTIYPFSMLTDETMLRLTFHMDDSNIEDLKYFHDVTYLDMGHNEQLTDISFIQYMPKLECVILSGSLVSDLSYLSNCQELVWLELCFCSKVKDLTPIQDLPNLKYLNVSYSQVADLSPLENLDLERFNCMNTAVNWENENNFKKWHPDCLSIFKGVQPYGYGWRYNDHGYTFFEYYANMRIIFRYDDESYYGNHKER